MVLDSCSFLLRRINTATHLDRSTTLSDRKKIRSGMIESLVLKVILFVPLLHLWAHRFHRLWNTAKTCKTYLTKDCLCILWLGKDKQISECDVRFKNQLPETSATLNKNTSRYCKKYKQSVSNKAENPWAGRALPMPCKTLPMRSKPRAHCVASKN